MTGQPNRDDAERQFRRMFLATTTGFEVRGTSTDPTAWFKVDGQIYEMPMRDFVKMVKRAEREAKVTTQ